MRQVGATNQITWQVTYPPVWSGASVQSVNVPVMLESVTINGIVYRDLQVIQYDVTIVTPNGWMTGHQQQIIAEFRERAAGERVLSFAIAEQQFRSDGRQIMDTLVTTYKVGLSGASALGGLAVDANDVYTAVDAGDYVGALETVLQSKREYLRAGTEGANSVQPDSNPRVRSVDDSLELVRIIRQELHVGRKRNVAYPDYEIDGEVGRVVGVSGDAVRKGASDIPEVRRFETFEIGHPRDFEAELKTLENLGSRLPSNAVGTLHLFSEIPFCASCEGVIDQFENAYPGIHMVRTHGPTR